MNTVLPLAAQTISTGETVMFWIAAPLLVLAALGVALCRKAVHSAVCMVAAMLILALLYIQQGGLFLGVVQVVVYTGAIMMMILFVVMMVGVSASDNYRKSSTGLRWFAWLAGAGLIALLTCAVVASKLPVFGRLADAAGSDNPVAVGISIFTEHTHTLVLADVLLITAVVGSMLLNHADRLLPKADQRHTLAARWNAWRTHGTHLGQLPAPGVYATTNAVDVPAISGETGEPIEASVSRVLRARGEARTLATVEPKAAAALRGERSGDKSKGLHGAAATKAVGRSGAWGMPGQGAPTGLRQPGKREVEAAGPQPVQGKEGEDK